ncbi:hypothetical protein GYMLUDRAFT_99884 [Collybiopsis luxurians FD-317 M1]|uniref:NAD(P)-binding protein n=1 Tax=Collybiopsis luxurians FD-317 M1 TaxID=944289 RepID=A0A0D0C9R2_9AGAR|nr:hypothetical protein GYMLUDRAFT_99884 [Collybiopsis luxurians FD-317 M1]
MVFTQHKGVALVTAAAHGVGRAIALRLASDGYKVAVHDIPHNGDQLIEVYRNIQRLGQHSMVMTADVTSEKEVKALVEDTYKCFGGFDIMVANASVREVAPITSGNAISIWDRAFAVNTRGVFLCYKYAAEQLLSEGKGGRIIGACSSLGERGSPLLSAYSASQFAIRGLTQSAALELDEYGITVNAYAPKVPDGASDPTNGVHSKVDKLRLNTLTHQAPQTVADLVSYLVSDEAKNVTGQIMDV